MRVFIPPPLRSYTGARAWVEAEGATLGAVLDALDARYPGFRFRIVDEQDRIRPHIRLVVRDEFAPSLAHPLEIGDEIQIICALSGGAPDRQSGVGGRCGSPSPVSARHPQEDAWGAVDLAVVYPSHLRFTLHGVGDQGRTRYPGRSRAMAWARR